MKYTIHRAPAADSEGFLNKSLRNLVSTGANAVSTITSPFVAREKAQEEGRNSLESSLANKQVPESLKVAGNRILESNKEPLIKVKDVNKKIENLFPDNYLQPKTENENTFQNFASIIPLHFATGGTLSALPKVLTTAAISQGAGNAVEGLGGGKVGNVLTQLSTPAVLHALNLDNLFNTFYKHKEDFYKNLPVVAGDSKVDATSLFNSLEKAEELSIGRVKQKAMLQNIQDIATRIEKGTIPVSQLQPLKAKLNALVYEDKLKTLKPVLADVNRLIKSQPAYAKEVMNADNLHKIFNNLERSNNFLKELQNVKGYKTKYGLMQKATRLIFKSPAIMNTKLAWNLNKYFPVQTKEYALEAFKHAADDNQALLIKSLSKMGNLIEKVEKKPAAKPYIIHRA